jgi:hypothetical protein
MYSIGTKVISRSNEDEPLRVGVITGFETFGHPHTNVPIVDFEGKEFICMSSIIRHSDEMEKFLNNFTPQEQWEIVSNSPRRYAVWSNRTENRRTVEIDRETVMALRKLSRPWWKWFRKAKEL